MKKTLLIFVSVLLLTGWIVGHAEDRGDRNVDSELKGLWNDMVSRLIEKDIESALGYFAYSTRGRYREEFTLIKERLPAIFGGMLDIESVYIKGDEAKYRIKIKEEGGERTGYIWFRKDLLGRWRIEKF